MNRFSALLLGLLWTVPSLAAPPGPPTRPPEREIEQLIASLGASGCQFQRNGSWYPPKKAEAHLRRKYEWLRERNMAATTEQFIERAGTQSSMTGRAYSVRCPGKPVVNSAAWLRARLLEMRKANPNPR